MKSANCNYLPFSIKLLLEKGRTVPNGLVVPLATVVGPAAFKNVSVISSDFAAELMSSTGIEKDDRLLTCNKASVHTFSLRSLFQEVPRWLSAYSLA